MLVPSLIERKRDGGSLTSREWADLLQAHGRGEVPDYQMSALLMAVVWPVIENGAEPGRPIFTLPHRA